MAVKKEEGLFNVPSADGSPNPKSAGSLTQKENTRDSLFDQESVKDMETGTLSPLSGILSQVGVFTGSVDRLDLGKRVQG